MTCPDCGSSVIQAQTIVGGLITLDAQPVRAGSFIISRERRMPVAQMVSSDVGGLRFTSHFATCRAALIARTPRIEKLKPGRFAR